MPFDSLREINAWRRILYLTQLVGRDPNRYGGFGYGNISQRLESFDGPAGERRFVISGTQTGNLAHLTEEHYATVRSGIPEGPRELLREYVAEGRLGAKGGRGFYEYPG